MKTEKRALVVIALVKLENLKAIHNLLVLLSVVLLVVIALVKLENLKAIHNDSVARSLAELVVIALVKLENLKAIHNYFKPRPKTLLLH